MVRSTLFGIMLSVSVSCISVEPELGRGQQAALGDNGLKMQGLKMQGLKMQGLKMQGQELGAAWIESFELGALSLNGSELVLQSDGGDVVAWQPVDAGWIEWRSNHSYTWSHRGTRWLRGQRRDRGLVGAEISATIVLGGLHGRDVTIVRPVRIVGARVDDESNTMTTVTTASGEPASSNDDIHLYRLELRLDDPADAATPADWSNLCSDKAGGEGIFFAGRWGADGAYQAGGITFACNDGVISKCARAWGYKPWKSLTSPITGATVHMRTLHQVCTRAARADYCGSGDPMTEEDTPVDFVDSYGFNVAETDPNAWIEEGVDPSYVTVESIFDRHGAIVHHASRFANQYELLDCTDANPDIDFVPLCVGDDGVSDCDAAIEQMFKDLTGAGPRIMVRSDQTLWPLLLQQPEPWEPCIGFDCL